MTQTSNSKAALGSKLRDLRERKGFGVREAAELAGVNHGYLSQLERNAVKQPAPAVLQKLADAYDEPFVMLMQWAGYLEDDPDGLSTNQQRALKMMGEPSDEELKAVRALLNALRDKGGTLSVLQQLDGALTDQDRAEIRKHVLALLRKADAVGVVPTPLDQVMDAAKLVAVDGLELEPEVKKRLRNVFGGLVDRAMEFLLGAVRFDSREVYVKPGGYERRRRFVQAHEIGHDLLPWQREMYAFLDDTQRLRPDIEDLYERQANQVAIEVLAQGDHLRLRGDDSLLKPDLIRDLSSDFDLSIQATVRRVVEESRKQRAVAVAYRGSATGKVMPLHLYCSGSFDQRFGWRANDRVTCVLQHLLVAGGDERSIEPLVEVDLSGTVAQIDLEYFTTRQARFLLCRVPKRISSDATAIASRTC